MASNKYCTRKLKLQLVLLIFMSGMLFVLRHSYDTSVTFFSFDKVNNQEKKVARPTLLFNKNITNWIVVNAIKFPPRNIETLVKIKGWQVLVVGDSKMPSNWSYPGCVFLGIDQQKELGFQVTSHLPTNSYTLKIIGYLFAIQNGAQRIYDTDDDNHPSSGNINFYQQQFTSGLIYDDVTDDVINPYAHFGQPSIWPRGFPLGRVGKPINNTYKLCTFKTPAIQQGLVNGDLHVDAIYRLTRKKPNERYINVTFDARAPPVTLPEGVFAPFNSQNTFFAYGAFWALFLPTSVAFRVTDIWRGYWAQRLLWLLGQRLSFLPPKADNFRNAHNYLQDFQDENQFYLQTSNLIDFLKNWTCSEPSFFACVSHLGRKMAAAAYWASSDAEMLDRWLADLVAIGYREPVMLTIDPGCQSTSITVYHSPVAMTTGRAWISLAKFCGRSSSDIASRWPTRPEVVHEDVLLIVVFNFPFYRNIPLLDTLYADHFPNIVYCGGPFVEYQTLQQTMQKSWFFDQERRLTFINTRSEKGYLGYDCAIYAMQMHYDVSGYIVVGDDVLLNFWNLEKIFNFSNPRIQLSEHRVVDRHRGPQVPWYWWDTRYGNKVANKAMDELEKIAQNHPDQNTRELMRDFISNRALAGLNLSMLSVCLADLYYVPKWATDMFVQVTEVFLKNGVFLEIAVPTTMTGLSTIALQDGFVGIPLPLGGARNDPFTVFNASMHYLHPVKLSSISGKNIGVFGKQFCDSYVDSLFENW